MAAKARRIEDAGEKIGGARKDRWRERAMTAEDLSDLTAAERVALVSKEVVWPVPDYAAMIASGVPVDVAALVKVIRDKVPTKPDMARCLPGTRRTMEAEDIHLSYVTGVGAIRDLAMAARSVADVSGLDAAVRERVGYRRLDYHSPGNLAYTAALRGNYGAARVSTAEIRRAEALVRDGWPDKASRPAWLKGHEVFEVKAGEWVAATQQEKRALTFGSMMKLERFASKDLAEAWLKDRYDAAQEASAAEAPAKRAEPKRPHLDRIGREGLPNVREGRDVVPEDFLSTFGFRGVEFGNWVADGERQQVLNLAYEALHDLADVMGLEPEALSFGGRLALAFGARGGGFGVAHYESVKLVVNMTRLRGAGSLAHEVGHALDHLAGDIARSGEGRGTVRSGSGWHDWTRGRADHLGNLDEPARQAWDRVMEAIRERPMSKREAVEAVRRKQGEHAELVAGQRKRLDDYLEKVPEARRDRTFVRKMREWLDRQPSIAAGHAAAVSRVESRPEDDRFGARPTDYMVEAGKLCGKGGDYWKRPTETFARAFEATVFDALAARGARSDYLVHGVEGDRYADGDVYKGNPYPAGEERERIRKAVLDVIDAMRPAIAELAQGMPAPAA